MPAKEDEVLKLLETEEQHGYGKFVLVGISAKDLKKMMDAMNEEK